MPGSKPRSQALVNAPIVNESVIPPSRMISATRRGDSTSMPTIPSEVCGRPRLWILARKSSTQFLPSLIDSAYARLAKSSGNFQVICSGGMPEITQQHDVAVEERKNCSPSRTASREDAAVCTEAPVGAVYRIPDENRVRIFVDDAGLRPRSWLAFGDQTCL